MADKHYAFVDSRCPVCNGSGMVQVAPNLCGQKPTVDIIEDGTVKHMELCGVCCFLDADCADPENW